MIRNNKLKYAISTAIILLPAIITLILWGPITERVNQSFVSVDGSGDITFMLFLTLFPVGLVVLNTALLLITGLDRRSVEQSDKVKNIIFYILPVVSLFVSSTFFVILLDTGFQVMRVVFALLGVLFAVIGNYMPKIKQNSYLGIKIRWTLGNKENWERTHRFAGILWFFGGILSLICMFLSLSVAIIALFVILAIMIIPVPIYSYIIYRKHIVSGAYTKEDYKVISNRKSLISVIVIFAVLVPIFVILMFTGEVEATLTDNAIEIEATYWSDTALEYTKIENVEYRENGVKGHRINGFSSPHINLGWFENKEFGKYTRYTYDMKDACIVIETEKGYLVLGLDTAEQTKELYDGIMQKMEGLNESN